MKIIILPKDRKKGDETYLQQLMREFNTSYPVVQFALEFKTNSDNAKRIRQRAKNLGGQEVTLPN